MNDVGRCQGIALGENGAATWEVCGRLGDEGQEQRPGSPIRARMKGGGGSQAWCRRRFQCEKGMWREMGGGSKRERRAAWRKAIDRHLHGQASVRQSESA